VGAEHLRPHTGGNQPKRGELERQTPRAAVSGLGVSCQFFLAGGLVSWPRSTSGWALSLFASPIPPRSRRTRSVGQAKTSSPRTGKRHHAGHAWNMGSDEGRPSIPFEEYRRRRKFVSVQLNINFP
jgi:hypothetical protein